MSQKLIKNGYMGNCNGCYYSSFDFKDGENSYYICHRFPDTQEKRGTDYCGEFARVEESVFDFN